MTELNNAVLKAFASTFLYYYKAHTFHWNLQDKDFYQYHGLFESIYSEVYDSIDSFAEKIRTLQVPVTATLTELVSSAAIKEQTGELTKDQMVEELYADGEKLLNSLKEAYNICGLYSKFGFENFLAERIDAHEKHLWMLRSSM